MENIRKKLKKMHTKSKPTKRTSNIRHLSESTSKTLKLLPILLILAIITASCATTQQLCPPTDIYIGVTVDDGSRIVVLIPAGYLNDPENYIEANQKRDTIRILTR